METSSSFKHLMQEILQNVTILTYLGTSVSVKPNMCLASIIVFGKLVERYQIHNDEEIGTSKDAGGTDKMQKNNSEGSGLRTGANQSLKMIQSDMEAQDIENLDIPELTQLEEELDAVLRRTRSRKIGGKNSLELSTIDNADTADDGNLYSSYRDAHEIGRGSNSILLPIAICLRAYPLYTCADERSMCAVDMPSLQLKEKQLKEEKLLLENEIAALKLKQQQSKDRAADEEPDQQSTFAANNTTTTTTNSCCSDDNVPAIKLHLFLSEKRKHNADTDTDQTN
ncbi:hypothetical protein DVH24_037802 [Malus domestica]|uniref:K-box domain-containing protein n=1 Tax=Malus domestica TaxID=3750 RepID=A0A498K1T6_MALDO|nr:hypothetical protein DVH24_037802 [Malus domestica]